MLFASSRITSSFLLSFVAQLARLSADDVLAVNNMRYLGGLDTKKTSGGGFSLKFDVRKVMMFVLYQYYSLPIQRFSLPEIFIEIVKCTLLDNRRSTQQEKNGMMR